MFSHLTIASIDRSSLVDGVERGNKVIRCLARLFPDRVLVFHIVDDHLHVVLATLNPGREGQRLVLALRAIGCPVAPAHIRAVADRAHLVNVVRYVLRQADHHGIDPAASLCWASSMPDLIGARLVPGLGSAPLRRALPRMTDAEPWAAIDMAPVHAWHGPRVASAGAPAIVAAAQRALAPRCRSKWHRDEVGLGRLVGAVCTGAGIAAADLALGLGTSKRSAWRHAHAVPESWIHAVHLQVALAATVPPPRPLRAASGHLANATRTA